jgi:hypothetical protein
MGCYILYLAINCQLLHLFNTIVITIINSNTKVISELMLIDLTVLDTIIHKRTFHIYLHNHSQKNVFILTHLITFILCNIYTCFTKSLTKEFFTYISST